ncbi:MAG: inorganic phosphate transporter [Planctomycetes bacterium]|nr:inorganic phosphate transporter [Planctomycetota bacterium]
MDTSLTLLILVVVAGLAFDFINGFHDTANAIATVVSTGVMRPRTAIIMAAMLNCIGAFFGTAVASTLGKDTVDSAVITQTMVLSAIISAILWNLFTWYFGIPSSSSHAIIGALIGVAWAAAGRDSIKSEGVEKMVRALVMSPLYGFFGAFVLMVLLTWVVRRASATKVNFIFRKLQLLSSGLMAFSHGGNDAQKTMGIITMALIAYNKNWVSLTPDGKLSVPQWVVLSCALAMGLGTAAGGWKIIHTMGSKIFKLRPIHGCCAETAAALVITVATHNGTPVSTTHCITSAIMGAGATTRLSAVSWGVTKRIAWAWVLTIPMCAFVGAVCFYIFRAIGL